MCPLSDFLQQSLLDVHLSRQQAEPHLRQVYTLRGFFVCIYQQGFVSFGIMLLSVILDPGGYFTSFQCQQSYHPVASSSCAFCNDMNF
jgi:hypothetical protein